jgi:Tic22-like family
MLGDFMKSLVRWGTTFGLVGSTLLATVLGVIAPVLALSEQQVKEKLDSVPVFLITNPQGVPLTRTLAPAQSGQKPATVADVFMSGQEAQSFMEQLRTSKGNDPKLGEVIKTLNVRAVPMGIIYEKFRENANKPDRVVFAFQPTKNEVDGAMTLLRQNGQQVKEFPSVPVFIVQSPDKGYVSVKRRQDNKEVIPLFLAKKDAQGLLEQVKQKVPNAQIQVVDIDGVIKTLREKNDDWLNQISLIPSSDSMQFIGKQPNNAAPRGNQAPAAKPNQGAPSKPKR